MPPLPGGGTLSFAGAARARAGLCVVGGAAHSAASSVHVLTSLANLQVTHHIACVSLHPTPLLSPLDRAIFLQ